MMDGGVVKSQISIYLGLRGEMRVILMLVGVEIGDSCPRTSRRNGSWVACNLRKGSWILSAQSFFDKTVADIVVHKNTW